MFADVARLPFLTDHLIELIIYPLYLLFLAEFRIELICVISTFS